MSETLEQNTNHLFRSEFVPFDVSYLLDEAPCFSRTGFCFQNDTLLILWILLTPFLGNASLVVFGKDKEIQTKLTALLKISASLLQSLLLIEELWRYLGGSNLDDFVHDTPPSRYRLAIYHESSNSCLISLQ